MSFDSRRNAPQKEPLPIDVGLISKTIEELAKVSTHYRVPVDPSKMKAKNDLDEYIASSRRRLDVLIAAMSVYGYQTEVQEHEYRGSMYPNAIFWKGPKDNGKSIEIGAHIDHCARRGHVDNASGISGMLGLAAAYANTDVGQKIRYRAFGMEEAGCIGSTDVLRNPDFSMGPCVSLVNLDSIGYGSDIIFMGREDLVPAHKEPSRTYLLRSMISDCFIDNNQKIELLEYLEGESDHLPYLRSGIPAATIARINLREYENHQRALKSDPLAKSSIHFRKAVVANSRRDCPTNCSVQKVAGVTRGMRAVLPHLVQEFC